MKRFIIGTLTVIVLAFVAVVTSNAGEETKKSRKEQKEEFSKVFDAKKSKAARQRAKELKKEGWQLIGGGSSFEEQLERAWRYQEPNDDGEMEYIVESGTGTADNRSGAINAAKLDARAAISRALESEISGLSESNLNNSVWSEDDAKTRADMHEVLTSFMHQNLKKAIVVTQWYRKTESRKYQAEVTLVLRISTLKEELNELWNKETKEKNEELQKKLSEKLKNSEAK